jgi:hypothetical protein
MVLMLVAGSALFFILDVPQAYARCFEQWRKIEELEKVNAQLMAEIRSKRERLRQLLNDPEQRELFLRERQKRVRPGDKVFVLPPE